MLKNRITIEFFKKNVLPIAIALILFFIFKGFCTDKTGDIDYLLLWILCGLPFGIMKMHSWLVLGGGDLGSTAAVFVLNLIVGGLIGGFILIWKLLVAVYYVLYTIYLLVKNWYINVLQLKTPEFLVIKIFGGINFFQKRNHQQLIVSGHSVNSTISFGLQSRILHNFSTVSNVIVWFLFKEFSVLLSIPALNNWYWVVTVQPCS